MISLGTTNFNDFLWLLILCQSIKKEGFVKKPFPFGVGNSFTPCHNASSIVHLLKDCTVLVSHSGVEMGKVIHTKMTCIAAKVLALLQSALFLYFGKILFWLYK